MVEIIQSKLSSIIQISNPQSSPLGYNYSEWCKRWCQWVVSIPRLQNPTAEISGITLNMIENNPHVTFLCQTIESVSSVPERHVNISRSTSIFMPIINWISFLGGDERSADDLKALASKMMNDVVKLHLKINGTTAAVDLRQFRFQSPVFDIFLPPGNIFDIEPGITKVVTDGFWLFFKPLVNSLKLETYGACRSGLTQIAVNYHIDICK